MSLDQFQVAQPGDVHGDVALASDGHMQVLVVLGCTTPSGALASPVGAFGKYQQ
jgi:hypothetical protein